LHTLVPCDLERWYSTYGYRARYNLSSSAAPPLSTSAVLAVGGAAAQADYLALDLDYSPQPGSLRLRTAIARRYASITAAMVQVTTGAAEALFLVLNALLYPGATVIVQFPIYPAISTLAASLRATVLRWPLGADGEVDLDRLAGMLVRHPAQAVVVNNPHSPTGAVLTQTELQQIADLATAHRSVLVVDEVYRGIQFAGPPTPAAADLSPSAISIGDVAKPYGLGGLRVGWIASRNAALLQRCAELRDYTTLCTSVPGEFLAALALEHHDALVEPHLATARINRAHFARVIGGAPWLEGTLANAGFTIFPRSHRATATLALCQDLCIHHDVLLLPGDVFAMPGHLRLGFGVEPAQFAAGLERVLDY
jgi:aspartate/methionine/tyrosine aminotransferase